MYKRDIQNTLDKWLPSKEIILLYGPRQSGKTTLLNMMFDPDPDALVLNCERPDVADILESKNLSRIKLIFGEKKIIALDEAQKIRDIGPLLKLIYDDPSFHQKIIATGSSSFELANTISEPLTGRNVKFLLLPLSIGELSEAKGWLWVYENLSQLLIFGFYPGIIDVTGDFKTRKLFELASDYLFKDVLIHENLRNPSLLRKLLKLLALQVGSQVSFHELSKTLAVSSKTIEKYADLLEKSFVIFSIPSYSRNQRSEIKKSRKFYFYDLGIRNALITNFNDPDSRTDTGAVWENFCVLERLKYNLVNQPFANLYFWRTYDGAEIDLIEEAGDKLNIYEFKWNGKSNARFPKSFLDNYPVNSAKLVSKENFHELTT